MQSVDNDLYTTISFHYLPFSAFILLRFSRNNLLKVISLFDYFQLKKTAVACETIPFYSNSLQGDKPKGKCFVWREQYNKTNTFCTWLVNYWIGLFAKHRVSHKTMDTLMIAYNEIIDISVFCCAHWSICLPCIGCSIEPVIGSMFVFNYCQSGNAFVFVILDWIAPYTGHEQISVHNTLHSFTWLGGGDGGDGDDVNLYQHLALSNSHKPPQFPTKHKPILIVPSCIVLFLSPPLLPINVDCAN